MKTTRTIIIAILIIFGAMYLNHVTAQSRISLSVFQDAKLLTKGDDKGNKAGTLNIISRLNLKGKQTNTGYLFVYPEYEYADLIVNYQRFSLGVGYSFNTLLKNFDFPMSANYGFIDREGQSFSSFSFNGGINYKITKHLNLATNLQLTDRRELDKFVWSGGIGIEVLFY